MLATTLAHPLLSLILTALLGSTKQFLGLVFIIIMIILVCFGFYGQANPSGPYIRYGTWPIIILLAIVGWVLFGPG